MISPESIFITQAPCTLIKADRLRWSRTPEQRPRTRCCKPSYLRYPYIDVASCLHCLRIPFVECPVTASCYLVLSTCGKWKKHSLLAPPPPCACSVKRARYFSEGAGKDDSESDDLPRPVYLQMGKVRGRVSPILRQY